MVGLSTETTGNRIRFFRQKAGLSQRQLAKSIEISAPYLNLIEKGKRNIGGALLVRMADQLNVSVHQITTSPNPRTVSTLSDIADRYRGKTETQAKDQERFAREFEDWANLILVLYEQIELQNAKIKSLSDRLANNPVLAKSMHDMLSMVTAIRSSAGILHETKDLEPQWQARFSRNIFEDSDRLVQDYKKVTELLINEDGELSEP